MKRFVVFSSFVLFASLAVAENETPVDSNAVPSENESISTQSDSSEIENIPKPTPKKTEKKTRSEKANSFVAGSDWEFDGFVSGGQDEAVKSMFYQGDTVYLNIGLQQGLNSGDRLALHKRGNKIKDPQTGRFMGYEVRLAAVAQVTDRIDANSCSVRIIRTNEAVEIGDLAKRMEPATSN